MFINPAIQKEHNEKMIYNEELKRQKLISKIEKEISGDFDLLFPAFQAFINSPEHNDETVDLIGRMLDIAAHYSHSMRFEPINVLVEMAIKQAAERMANEEI